MSYQLVRGCVDILFYRIAIAGLVPLLNIIVCGSSILGKLDEVRISILDTLELTRPAPVARNHDAMRILTLLSHMDIT